MVAKMIQGVQPEPRTWDGRHGPSAAVKVFFSDGEEGEVFTKPEYAAKHIAALTALVNKEGDFLLSDQGKWNDGNPKPWKITEYPGKPTGQRPEGGGSQNANPERDASIQSQKAIAETFRAISTAMSMARTLVESEVLPAKDMLEWVEVKGMPFVIELMKAHQGEVLEAILGNIHQPRQEEPEPQAVPTSTTQAQPPSSDRLTALNGALAIHKSRGNIETAYIEKFDKVKMVDDMTTAELLTLGQT